jgi:hypothetical protein
MSFQTASILLKYNRKCISLLAFANIEVSWQYPIETNIISKRT